MNILLFMVLILVYIGPVPSTKLGYRKNKYFMHNNISYNFQE